MTIKVQCANPECGKVLTLDESLAGKRIRCNACRQVVQVPGGEGPRDSASAAPQPRRPRSSEPRRRSRSGSGDRRRTSRKEAARPGRSQPPRRTAPPRRAQRDDFEDYEDYEDDLGPGESFDEYDDQEDDFDFALPRRGASRSSGGSWSKVGVGLVIVTIGACIFAASLGLLVLSQAGSQLGVLMMVSASDLRPDFDELPRNAEEARALMERQRERLKTLRERGESARSMMDFGMTVRKVSRIVGLIAGVVCLVGYVFFVFAPNQSGTLAFAITALVLAVVNPVLRLIFQVIPEFKDDERPRDLSAMALTAGGPYDTTDKILGLLFDTSFYLELLMVALFLATAAGIKKRGELKKRNLLTVYLWGGVLGAVLFVYVLVFVDWNVTPTSRWPLYLVWFVHWLTLLLTGAVTFLYIRSLILTRRAVT